MKLTRRRLLGGLTTVAGASAAAGAGTMAAFSDSETSSDASVQAGTLDLTLDGKDQTVTFLDVSGIAPGAGGSQSVTLGNAGSVAGELEIVVDEWHSYENGVQRNENDSTTNRGELQKYLSVRAQVGETIIGDGWYRVENIPQGESFSPGVTMGPGDTREFTVDWQFEIPDSGNAKDAQSDRLEIDLTFRLVQT